MAKKKPSLLTSKPRAPQKASPNILKTKPALPKAAQTKPSGKAPGKPSNKTQGKPKAGLLKAKTTRRTDEVKKKALALAGAEELKRLNLNVPRSFHAKVKTFAITQGDDISGIVVAALNEYMSKRSR
jgi:hypothetical protein